MLRIQTKMITTQFIWESSGDSALNMNSNQKKRGLKDDAGSMVGTTVTGLKYKIL